MTNIEVLPTSGIGKYLRQMFPQVRGFKFYRNKKSQGWKWLKTDPETQEKINQKLNQVFRDEVNPDHIYQCFCGGPENKMACLCELGIRKKLYADEMEEYSAWLHIDD